MQITWSRQWIISYLVGVDRAQSTRGLSWMMMSFIVLLAWLSIFNYRIIGWFFNQTEIVFPHINFDRLEIIYALFYFFEFEHLFPK